MDRNVGSKTPVYGMLMTVVFYTTGFICGLRILAWFAMHTLIPAASHILALCYRPLLSNPTPPSPGASGAGDAAGLLFKLIHTAAGHDLLVPVPVPVASMYHMSAEGTSGPGRTIARFALCAFMISACGIAAYCYFLVSIPLFVIVMVDAVFTERLDYAARIVVTDMGHHHPQYHYCILAPATQVLQLRRRVYQEDRHCARHHHPNSPHRKDEA